MSEWKIRGDLMAWRHRNRSGHHDEDISYIVYYIINIADFVDSKNYALGVMQWRGNR